MGKSRTLSAYPSHTPAKPSERALAGRAVAILARSVASDEDEDFVRVCVRALAELYAAQFAVAGVFADESRRSIETLAVWAGDGFGDNFSYHLDGTPCDDILNRRVRLIPDRLCERYPQDELRKGLGVQSYFGAPLVGGSGEILGILSVMDSKPISLTDQTAPVLSLFAVRLAAELERREARASLQRHLVELESAQQALTTSEARYRELFDHAPIGIWEDDWSDVKPVVDQLNLDGAGLLRYLNSHPAFTRSLTPRSRRANAAAVAMYKAPSSHALCQQTNKALWNQGELENFCRTLAAFVDGKFTVTVEGWEQTYEDEDIYVRDTVVIPAPFRANWERVIHSTEDRTVEHRTETLLATERQLLELIAKPTSANSAAIPSASSKPTSLTGTTRWSCT